MNIKPSNTRLHEDSAEDFHRFVKTLPKGLLTSRGGLVGLPKNIKWQNLINDRLLRLNAWDFWQVWQKRQPECIGFCAKNIAWCLPKPKLIRKIKNLSNNILDLGAGSGFFSRLLEEAGIKVTSLEYAPPYLGEHGWLKGDKSFHSGIVARQTIQELCNDIRIYALSSPFPILLLSWADPESPELAEEVATFRENRGKLLIVAGSFSLVGCPELFSEFEQHWQQLEHGIKWAYKSGGYSNRIRFFVPRNEAPMRPNPLERFPNVHIIDENKEEEGQMKVFPPIKPIELIEDKSFEGLHERIQYLHEKLFFLRHDFLPKDFHAMKLDDRYFNEKTIAIKNIYSQFKQTLNELKNAARKENAEEMAIVNKMENNRSKWGHRLQKLYKAIHKKGGYAQLPFVASTTTDGFGSLSHLAHRPKRMRRKAKEFALQAQTQRNEAAEYL